MTTEEPGAEHGLRFRRRCNGASQPAFGNRDRAPHRCRRDHGGSGGPRLPRSHRRARAGGACFCTCRRRLGAAGRAQSRSRPQPRRLARGSGRHQGRHRYRRPADPDGLADLCRPSPRLRCGLRRAAARCGCRHPGQDRHGGIRRHDRGPDHQSAQSGAYARRLIERIGGRGRRLHAAGRARHPDRRLGAAARRLLRGDRLQADLRGLQSRRPQVRGRKPRHHRVAGALPRRRRAHHLGPARRPNRRAGFARRPAQDRIVPHAAVGGGRAGDETRGRGCGGAAGSSRRTVARGRAPARLRRPQDRGAGDHQQLRALERHGGRMGQPSRSDQHQARPFYRARHGDALRGLFGLDQARRKLPRATARRLRGSGYPAGALRQRRGARRPRIRPATRASKRSGPSCMCRP